MGGGQPIQLQPYQVLSSVLAFNSLVRKDLLARNQGQFEREGPTGAFAQLLSVHTVGEAENQAAEVLEITPGVTG